MIKKHEITISVTLNGSEISRDYMTEDLDHFASDREALGERVQDMLDTLIKEDHA